MRRQRFAYTLPSEDDSSYFLDSDNMSILSSPYSYPETPVWPQIISPEPDSLIPYYVLPYTYIEVPAEPMPFVPGIYNLPLCPEAFGSFPLIHDDLYPCSENLCNIYSPINIESSCNFSCGDGIITEGMPPCADAPTDENFNDMQDTGLKILPSIANYGAVTVLLRHLIRIDISPAKAVYVSNPPAECIAAVNGVGNKSCVIHPNGRVLQSGQDIHIETLNRQAKICKRGIIFSSSDRCLSYLVDESGTKTTSEKFRNLNHDFSLEVFYTNGMTEKNLDECQKMVNEAKYRSFKNGDEVWNIGGIRIKQDQRGEVKVTKNGDRFYIKTSPTSGEISVKSISAEISIGRYPDSYFSVVQGNKHVTASLRRFIVRNGTQKSGFNSSGKVALF